MGEQQVTMNTLVLASVLAFASALPIEDTPEVAAAKAEFAAAFAAAEAGEHAALAPVNTDVQAPAPVHVIPEPVVLAAAPATALPATPYGVTALNAAYPYTLGLPAGIPYAGLPAGLPYAGLPYSGLPYSGLPLGGYPYAGLPLVAAPAEAKAEE